MMVEVGMAVQKSAQLGWYARDNKVHLTSLLLFTEMRMPLLESSRDVTCTFSLACYPCLCTFCSAIPTSTINFIQLFLTFKRHSSIDML